MIITRRLIEEFEFVQGIGFKEKDQYQQKIRTQSWLAPQNDLSKINTDAAIDRSGTQGVVAVVYHSIREIYATSAMVIPHITNPKTLEVMSCSKALALAEDCGFKSLIVASDCLNIVKNIKEMLQCPYLMILHDIHQRPKSLNFVRFAR
jgi:ribonuclease HI